MQSVTERQVIRGDLPDDLARQAQRASVVAWDIETSGLNWREDSIGTCQVAFGGAIAIVVVDGHSRPTNLVRLLEAHEVQKVFHHAPFDLRFMTYQWRCQVTNVACTKIASKILDPHLEPSDHSLRPVLARHLGVDISKAEQRSDWLRRDLTDAQVQYAATDVAYLAELVAVLLDRSDRQGLQDLVLQSWAYLPARVALDLRGSGDVFAY